MYKEAIAASVGTTDLATLALIEDLMRAERTGLDGLSREQFRTAARRAMADAQLMAAAGELRGYCEALGLALPMRFTGGAR